MPRSFAIRPATLQDLPHLVALETACFVTDRFAPWQFRYLLNATQNLALVAVQDQRVVGYAIFLCRRNLTKARLYGLAVDPTAQRQGIGTALIAEGQKILGARGKRSLTLEVRADAAATIRLYTQLGFRVLQQLPAYYERGRDGLRMIKDW